MKLHKITGQKVSQKDKELAGLIKEIQDANCTKYLEIGARQGNTFYDVMMSLPKGSIGVCVDLPAGAWGKSGTEKYLAKVVEELKKEGYKIHMILGDSTDPKVIEKIKSFGPYDAALIDGDHRYEGVKKDWENYMPIVNKIIAFHDIDGRGVVQKSNPDLIVEVPTLWDELKQKWLHKEFIDNEERPEAPMGIGVIYKSDKSNETDSKS